jgi:Collagen triple helix repeat (20 copies)
MVKMVSELLKQQ